MLAQIPVPTSPKTTSNTITSAMTSTAGIAWSELVTPFTMSFASHVVSSISNSIKMILGLSPSVKVVRTTAQRVITTVIQLGWQIAVSEGKVNSVGELWCTTTPDNIECPITRQIRSGKPRPTTSARICYFGEKAISCLFVKPRRLGSAHFSSLPICIDSIPSNGASVYTYAVS